MKTLRRLWLKLFPRYEVSQRIYVREQDAILLHLSNDPDLPTCTHWVVDDAKQYYNGTPGMVYLCRRKRIVE